MSESFPSVEVSIFSSFLPLPRTAAPEPTHDYWSLALEYNALPWRRACNRPNRCVSQQLRVFMERRRSASCLRAKALSLSVQIKGPIKQSSLISCRPPMLWRKATGWCQVPHKVLPIHWVYLGKRHVCKRDTPSSSLYRGCGLRGEMDTSGVRSGNRFQSLHLTKDMLDINLAGWHWHEKWDFDFVGSPPYIWDDGWKIPFVFIAAQTNILTWLKQMCSLCAKTIYLGGNLQHYL